MELKTCIELPLPAKEINNVIQKAKDWAIIHGISMRPKNCNKDEVQIAPFLLLPSSFPKCEFEKAVNVQTKLNELMHKVAYDYAFIEECLKSTIEADEFTAKLFKIYETVHGKYRKKSSKVYSLGLFRSDYMLHGLSNKILQVEINTIASSFGGLSAKTTELHRFILTTLGQPEKLKNIPDNNSTLGLSSGLAEAWSFYNKKDSIILFVVETETYNISDQRSLEFQVQQLNPKIKIIRKSLEDLGELIKLGPQNELFVDDSLVSVVYYRSAYVPSFYPTENEWKTRLIIEQSSAIKCPSIHYQLAGTKKVQQMLATPGVLEKFIHNESDVKSLRELFTGIYSLDFDSAGNEAVEMALKQPENFVLKPQREGGGHNIYGEDVRTHLEKIKDSADRSGWILMNRIVPPTNKNYLIRAGSEDSDKLQNVITELGIYGVVLGNGDEIVLNKQAGHLLRTKLDSSNEGGIIAGYGAMDSPYLVL